MARDPNDLFEIHGIDMDQDDPNDLFQQQQRQQQPEQQQPENFMQKMQNNFGGGIFTGLINGGLNDINQAGNAPRAMGYLLSDPSGINELLGNETLGSMMPKLPQVQIPQPENPRTGYKVGNFIGEWGPLAYGGYQFLKPAIPYATRAANAAINKIPGADFFKNIHPDRYEKKLVNMTSKKYLDDIAKPSVDIYENLKSQTRDAPLAFTEETLDRLTAPHSETVSKLYKDPDIKEVYKAFEKKMGYETAEDLRIALGKELGVLRKVKLKNEKLTIPEKNKQNAIYEERKTLSQFIKEQLDEKKLFPKFQEANLHYRTKVIPSEKSAKIIGKNIGYNKKPINKRKLINDIENATNLQEMRKGRLPIYTIKTNKKYEQNLNNKESLMSALKRLGWGAAAVTGTAGAGKLLFGRH
jgi:hypothetical protein